MLHTRIKNRRKELGLTQDELAKRVGYKTKGAISRIENGDRDLNQTQITQFAQALNTTEAYLMGWKESPDKKSTTSPKEAIKTLLSNDVVSANTGINIDDYSDEELEIITDRLLEYARFLNNDKRNNK